jgi:hypothetical protein
MLRNAGASIVKRSSSQFFAVTVLTLAVFGGPFVLVHRTAMAADDAAVKQIDTDCLAIQNAVMALHPVHLAYQASQWKVLSDADYAIAERNHELIAFIDAWKQGDSYAWIHAHSFNEQGTQRATQLCFRQKDGSLERARQATTIPGLSSANAQQAYFASDGTVIQKSDLFEMNDPAIAKQVKDLPFYKALP